MSAESGTTNSCSNVWWLRDQQQELLIRYRNMEWKFLDRSSNDLKYSTKRNAAGSGYGTTTAALNMCWWRNTWSCRANTESYDGTSWTEENNMNTAKRLFRRQWKYYKQPSNRIWRSALWLKCYSSLTEIWDGTLGLKWLIPSHRTMDKLLGGAGSGTTNTRSFSIYRWI